MWQKPDVGWVKVNSDAAVIPATCHIGTSAVIRDEDGRFLHARCMDIEGNGASKRLKIGASEMQLDGR